MIVGAIPVDVLYGNPVPHAVDGALERGVPAFGRVGVRHGRGQKIVATVFAGRMVDAQVRPEFAADPSGRRQFVAGQHAVQRHVAEQEPAIVISEGVPPRLALTRPPRATGVTTMALRLPPRPFG